MGLKGEGDIVICGVKTNSGGDSYREGRRWGD